MAEHEHPRYGLFVSYAAANRAWVEGYLLDALEQAGVRSIHQDAFEPGVPQLEQFEQAVMQSERTLLVLSAAYLSNDISRFVNRLAQTYSLDQADWIVIPLLLEQPLDLPLGLKVLTPLDASRRELWPDAIERLLRQLKRPHIPATPAPRCPYRGIEPFRVDDHFYGRSEQVMHLMVQLQHQDQEGERRLLTLIGASGSGKSSLVAAGLIPSLRTAAVFNHLRWSDYTVRPSEWSDCTLYQLIRAARSAADVVAQLLAKQQAQALLLVVDQLEELFTTAGHAGPSLQAAILELSRVPGCFVVLTVRADFFADLIQSTLWPHTRSTQVLVEPLDADNLRLAIVKPAQAEDVWIDPALVERLVAEAAEEPGAMPLVQETMFLLWQFLDRRFLGLDAYEHVIRLPVPKGDAGGGRATALQVAMACRAEHVLLSLSDDQQNIARRVFLCLVQFGEGRAHTRRQQMLDELAVPGEDPQAFRDVLEHLTAQRLLTQSGDERSDRVRVDIAHEVLISGWPRLRTWIESGIQAELRLRRLKQAVAEWERSEYDHSFLYSGLRLAEAEPALAQLKPNEQAFIRASQALRDVGEQRRRDLEHSHYLLQVARSQIMIGLGYGVTWSVIYSLMMETDDAWATLLIFLLMFPVGSFVGLCVGLVVSRWRHSLWQRTLAASAVGAVTGAMSYVAILQLLFGGRGIGISQILAGLVLGAGVGLGASIRARRWPRLIAAPLVMLVAALVARATGGLPQPLLVVLSASLVLGGATALAFSGGQRQPDRRR